MAPSLFGSRTSGARVAVLISFALLGVACGDSEQAGTVSDLPCDVAAILQEHCQSCHGDPRSFGAPMTLLSRADLVADSLTDPATSMAEALLKRVQDEQSPMPPPGNPRLSAQQIGVLKAFVEAGLPEGEERCDAAGPGGAAESSPGAPADCEEFHDFLAHGKSESGDSSPFDVSAATSGDLYECFNFRVPWGTDPLQALYFEPLPGDKRVLHHYILYGIEDGAGMQDGSIGCSDSAGRFRMEGWAPGRAPSVMPKDIGFQLPTGPEAFIQLEIHYNNVSGYTDAKDRSGVRMCTTKTLRQHTAASHWLGTEQISVAPNARSTAEGTCSPSAQATILRVGPHMHKRGVHMKTVIQRADGSVQSILDQAFSFENQIQYDLDPPVVVGPGDKLTTTCTYEDTDGSGASFGPNTENEMCYDFVTAYPAGALTSAGLDGVISSQLSKNRCITLLGR